MNAILPPLRRGAVTADEIYNAVGMALSWWESSEDQLLGLFKVLSGDDIDRIVSYGKATRNVRAQMMGKTIRLKRHLFRDGELKKLEKALEGLSSLLNKRNEISHGYCSNCTFSCDGGLTLQGHFLVSAMNELGPMERHMDMRFALSADDIHAFITELRSHRGIVQDAWLVMTVRAQQMRIEASGGRITYGPGTLRPDDTF